MLKDLYGEKHSRIAQADLNVLLTANERYVTGRGGARTHFKLVGLDGLNLANRILNEIDFSGASLVGANLYGSSLLRAILYCADLRSCDLRNAKLMGADLRGALFRGANLSHAILDNADLRAATMMHVQPGGVSIVGRNEKGQDGRDKTQAGSRGGVDFSHCSLKNASFGNAKLDDADFSGALLHGANFRGARLENVTMKGAVLTGVDLSQLALPPETIAQCVTDAAPQAVQRAAALKNKLEAHQRWISTDGKEGAAAVLDGEDLRPLGNFFVGRALTGLSARQVMAIGINFSGCQLQAAKFDGSDLRDCDFSEAELSAASFANTKLAHAKFAKAHIGNLRLLAGKTILPNFAGAEANAKQFQDAVLDANIVDLGLNAEANS